MATTALASFALGFLSWSGGQAYDEEGYVFCAYDYSGSGLLYIYHRNDPDFPPESTYGTAAAYSAAASGWNGVSGPQYLWPNASGEAWFAAIEAGPDEPYGHTDDICSWGDRFGSDTWLNINRFAGMSANERQSVASHELGHVIAIRHSYQSPAVMNESRNRSVTYGPQADDICGVKDRYNLPC